MVLVGVAMSTLLLLSILASPAFAFVQEPPSLNGVSLPNMDCGVGLFYCPQETANETGTLAAMRDAGCNTFAPQARPLPGQTTPESAGAAIARQVNSAARVGLLDVRFPLVCYSVVPADVVEANTLRDPAIQWPELIQQSVDEPSALQEATLRDYRDKAHAAGLRIGTAVAGYVCTGYTQSLPWCEPEGVGKLIPGMGKYLDLWVLLVGTWGEATREAAQAQGAEIGAYLAYPSSTVLDRWTCGLWAWRARVRTVLLWAALNKQAAWDYSRVREAPGGSCAQPGLSGVRDGTLDYRVLQAVRDLHIPEADRWLAGVEARVDLGWWPHSYVATNQDKEVPTVDMDNVRADGLALLKEAAR